MFSKIFENSLQRILLKLEGSNFEPRSQRDRDNLSDLFYKLFLRK